MAGEPEHEKDAAKSAFRKKEVDFAGPYLYVNPTNFLDPQVIAKGIYHEAR
jgi:hypothetical protein